mmetsp:Transcript_12469/g.20702  ORF Transcript_12469/g.20702 Transcript_12469/m.20702 type:complete len:272 (+) Transcript_12469:84-899(+)|eukprot:CAMPEP_0119027974 /NCGR_PEP_ID=MMETSP1176-20130426/38063_1 /TAXON_ID=265551 /ORGANISM="Synedropsis recta cf, Strain CCMP1620" /LENGTH=271 /DNA_ID=CAMNT_0006984009 /DNA_START=29 /DNA_END=844 /DNA_ORIENTATION=-
MCSTTKKESRKRKPFGEVNGTSSIEAKTTSIAPASRPTNKKQKRKTASSSSVIEPQGRTKTNEPIRCWAHSKTAGNQCPKMVTSREGEPIPIPYCDVHLTCGDGAIRRVSHPFAGHCLVASHDLPKNYRMVLWGYRGKCNPCDKEDRSVSFYPPHAKTGRNFVPFTKTLRTDNYNGVLNPKDTGDLLQFASCPGPTERQNMRSTFQYFGLRNGHMAGLEYVTLEPIAKNTQLCQWYGSGWWSARELKRCDVGTTRYPAPKRKSLEKEAAAA